MYFEKIEFQNLKCEAGRPTDKFNEILLIGLEGINKKKTN